ncbi:MAG: protein kinase domain-containing protein, partial [Frankia sp.]
MLAPLGGDDPRHIGPYRLHSRLGAGGMGVVYLGFTDGDQPVAVKVASASLAGNGELRHRFAREVAAARRVRGGCVAGVLDADTTAERPWMVTEYVDGVSLADAVNQRGPLGERMVHGLAVGLADALVAIHAAGVVHRDLKPSNVLLAWDGPKVIDFGIARLAGADRLTRAGQFVGTPAWMAPEHLRGDDATAAADIFGWGACVVFGATGRHPFGDDHSAAVAYRVVNEPPDLAGLPADLAGPVAAALAKDPAERPRASDLLAGLLVAPAGAAGGGPGSRLAPTAIAARAYLSDVWASPPKPDPAPRPLRPAPASRAPSRRLAPANRPVAPSRRLAPAERPVAPYRPPAGPHTRPPSPITLAVTSLADA